MREMAMSDWTSGINYAREEGIREGMEKGVREGMEKGVREGMEKIAVKMKKRGASVAQIAEYTELSIGDIAKL
jgi:predicted transposase/invertase (TIGR01784 family)